MEYLELEIGVAKGNSGSWLITGTLNWIPVGLDDWAPSIFVGLFELDAFRPDLGQSEGWGEELGTPSVCPKCQKYGSPPGMC